MGSISITDLLGGISVRDHGAWGNGNGDDGPAINRAILAAYNQTWERGLGGSGPTGSVVFLEPGVYRLETPVAPRSNVHLMGFGSGSILKAANDSGIDVLACEDVSSFRLSNFRVDGNRANNTSGNGVGVSLRRVVDAWLNNIEFKSCRVDGLFLDDCDRVELTGCKAWDNGSSGFLLYYSRYNLLMACRAYDNCQVATAGTKDGIRLENMSQYNTIIAPVCYETALAGQFQGYGVREAPGESSQRNLCIGAICPGNMYGEIYFEGGDSVVISRSLVSFPGGITITA